MRQDTRPLHLVALQVAPIDGAANFARFADQAHAIRNDHREADLLVWPELHLFPFDDPAALRAAAQPLGSTLDRQLGQLAGELGVCLVPGTLCEAGPNGELFNVARVYGPDGMVIATYRKIFPWRPREPFTPGDEWVTFKAPAKDHASSARIGLTICYDAWFPEATRQVAWLGAELVLNLVKTTTCDRAQELILARANAIVNQCFVLSLNIAGPIGQGDSLLVGPEGEIIASCPGQDEGRIAMTIDLNHVDRIRREGTCGENLLWHQMRSTDRPIPLPAYAGRIDPADWNPAKSQTAKSQTAKSQTAKSQTAKSQPESRV